MIYLEAPAGVGFSYSDDASDYETDDDQTALDRREHEMAPLARTARERPATEDGGGHGSVDAQRSAWLLRHLGERVADVPNSDEIFAGRDELERAIEISRQEHARSEAWACH